VSRSRLGACQGVSGRAVSHQSGRASLTVTSHQRSERRIDSSARHTSLYLLRPRTSRLPLSASTAPPTRSPSTHTPFTFPTTRRYESVGRQSSPVSHG